MMARKYKWSFTDSLFFLEDFLFDSFQKSIFKPKMQSKAELVIPKRYSPVVCSWHPLFFFLISPQEF